MNLPKNILSGLCESPEFYLCETDKSIIGLLQTYEEDGVFKFNDYDEMTCKTPRIITDPISGENILNPMYDLVAGLRMLYVVGFGYFQIQSADISTDGIQEYKTISAYSSEYDMSQKYLENFIINMGTDGSVDGVQLYNANDTGHSLLHLVFEKIPTWSIGHIDAELTTLQRSFEVDRTSVYDFIMTDMAETFKYYTVFDTIHNTINLYTEDSIGRDTDIYIALDTISCQADVKYVLDDIKTVFTVKGADDLDIRNVNLGMPYIMNLSYYDTVEWMGQDLYNAYEAYKHKTELYSDQYSNLISKWNTLYNEKSELYNLVPDYDDDSTIEEVSDYNSLPEAKIENYGLIYKVKNPKNQNGDLIYVCNSYVDLHGTVRYTWDLATDEYGVELLKEKEEIYKTLQQLQAEAGWSETTNNNYQTYLSNYTRLQDIQSALKTKQSSADYLQGKMDAIIQQVNEIANDMSMSANFTEGQMMRLTPFLREDEYSDDNFVTTELDTEEDLMKLKTELKKTAEEELAKVSQPQLEFTLTMANIYAIPEFAPVIDDFEGGNRINVILRPDYYASVRILQIDMDFSDLTSFAVTFGNLAAYRSQTDIHADLLQQAASAGKSIASNSSNWQRGYNVATDIDKKIQTGLIDATTSIKSNSNGQAAEWDNHGVHLRKYKDGSTTEYEDEQIWLTNNRILFTDDNFKTSRTLLGKFSTDGGKTYEFGLVASAVVAGTVTGSTIQGGTLQIGLQSDGSYAFEIHSDGSVVMNGGVDSSTIKNMINNAVGSGGSSSGTGSGTETGTTIDAKMYRTEVHYTGSAIMNTKGQTATLSCKVFSWDNDITSTLSASYFSWKRSSNDSASDTTWNNDVSHQCIKTLTISTDDVINNANFYCEVFIPD